MATTQWGRKETIIFPPHSPIYTYGAFLLAVIATGLFVYLRFSFVLTPLQQFYLPYYLRTQLVGTLHKTDKYQLLAVADAEKHVRLATEGDVEKGWTQEANGKRLPLQLSPKAHAAGLRALYRGPQIPYLNQPLHAYLQNTVYGGDSPWTIFRLPILFGLVALGLQLPASITKDIRRRKEMKYGRRLKGPFLVSPKGFNKAVKGDGVGIKTDDYEKMMRIPLRVEDQHIELMGDTGSGKTSLIMQILRQVQSRGHSAIVYDPACEFVQRFYDPDRHDIILNPLDRRCPYWGPAEELRRKAEAKAIAASLYQPTTDKKGEFFVETPQKIFAHLLTFGPSPQELVAWMANPDEIDRRVQGTEMAMMIAKGAQQQRNGVLASLGLIADSLRMLPRREHAERSWSATEWAKERQGWIFITSQPSEREALRPLNSLWIDLLVLRLLNAPTENQRPVWFVLDELASLQRLPQLHTAITENRKSKNPLVLGFQGKAQLEVIYGHIAEVMLSQPATKIFLKTTEPKAAEWVSAAIGKVEIERLKETHFDGSRSGKNFSLDRQAEPLVMDSEISGLDPMHAFLKLGNWVARFSFSYSDLPKTHPAFEPRTLEDDELGFDPVTLEARKPEPTPTAAEMPTEEEVEEDAHAQAQGRFSLGE